MKTTNQTVKTQTVLEPVQGLKFVFNTANLDTDRYKYVAIKHRGHDLTAGPNPVKAGDVLAMRELKRWNDSDSTECLSNFENKLVAMIVGEMRVCGELRLFLPGLQRIMLRCYNPDTQNVYRSLDVTRVFAIDAIIADPTILNTVRP